MSISSDLEDMIALSPSVRPPVRMMPCSSAHRRLRRDPLSGPPDLWLSSYAPVRPAMRTVKATEARLHASPNAPHRAGNLCAPGVDVNAPPRTRSSGKHGQTLDLQLRYKKPSKAFRSLDQRITRQSRDLTSRPSAKRSVSRNYRHSPATPVVDPACVYPSPQNPRSMEANRRPIRAGPKQHR
jgi:hypothetical protein